MLAQVHAQIASGKLLSALARLLSEGDLLSVGNFDRPRFPRPGEQYRAHYLGLAEPAPEVLAVYR